MRVEINMFKQLSYLFTATVMFCSFALSNQNAFAISNFYSSNDIMFYDSKDSGCPGGFVSVGVATQTKSLEEFVDKYGQIAYDVGQKYGIPYEAILAQGVIESAYGKSGLTTSAYNFFGIKASAGWTGEVIDMQTGEVYDGNSVIINATFRKYPSVEAGWDGYGQFITQNPRYSSALNHPGDPIAYLTALKTAGYATDPNYINKVGSIANTIKNYISTTNKWQPSSAVTTKVTNPSTSPITYSACSGLISGGMTLIQAQQFMEEYIKSGLNYSLNNPGCSGGVIANCVAFSQYFIKRYTNKEYDGKDNGKDVTRTLLALGFQDGGHTPKAYSIFSKSSSTITINGTNQDFGHTGVVLGVDTTNNKIVIGEASCGSGINGIKATEYNLSDFSNDNYTYAYTDSFLNGINL